MTEKKIEEMTVETLIKPFRHPEDGAWVCPPNMGVVEELIRRAKLYEQSQQAAVKELEGE